MGFRMKDFNIFGFHRKICAFFFFFFLGQGEEAEGQEKTIYRGDCPKKGAWTVCRYQAGLAVLLFYFGKNYTIELYIIEIMSKWQIKMSTYIQCKLKISHGNSWIYLHQRSIWAIKTSKLQITKVIKQPSNGKSI